VFIRHQTEEYRLNPGGTAWACPIIIITTPKNELSPLHYDSHSSTERGMGQKLNAKDSDFTYSVVHKYIVLNSPFRDDCERRNIITAD
jgi:hypothetical protein